MMFFETLHREINIPGLEFFNSFTENEILANLIFYMADMPIFIIPLFLVGAWIYYNFKKDPQQKQHLLFIFYSMCLAILVSIFIQQFVSIDRPETSIENANRLILEHIPDASFPSDHASVALWFLAGLWLFGFRKFAIIITPFFIFMLLSRIAGWLHWPFDIIVGSLVWIWSAFCIYKSQNMYILKKTNQCILKIAWYFKL